MKNLTVTLVFLFMALVGNAQWLTPYTTATCGGTGKIANSPGDTTFITYTIGQAITLSGYLNGDTTQGSLIGGFQQPFIPVSFCGTIANETRTFGPGYVYVCGNINVNNGGILKIEPQTTFIFEGVCGINVTGTGKIIAKGILEKPICFVNDTMNTPGTFWKGIRFENMNAVAAQPSEFEYCTFQNADVISLNQNGGGMFVKNFPKVILSNCLFTGCKAKNGGGLAIEYDPLTVITPLLDIQHCTFFNNQATEAGGGLYLKGLPFEFSLMNYNEFNLNQATNGGGAYFLNCDPVLMNGNFYQNNLATVSGGALYVNNTVAKNLNSILANNFAQNGGAVYAANINALSLYNNTLPNNKATFGPALYTSGNVTTECYNNILWGNRTNSGSIVSAYLSGGDVLKVTNSCIESGQSGITGLGSLVNPGFPQYQYYIITENPGFSDPTGIAGTGEFTKITDWQLECYSSCINKGYVNTNDPNFFIVGDVDILNNVRKDGVIDIGAIEGQTKVYYANDTLSGELEICYNIEVRGGTLTIEPGARLKFLGPYQIKVTQNGCIRAVGTENDSILFTSASTNNALKWKGLILDNINPVADSSIFRQCIFEGVYYEQSAQVDKAPVRIFNSPGVEFSQNTIRNNSMVNQVTGILIRNCSPKVQRNFVMNNSSNTGLGGSIMAENCQNLAIVNNYIISNKNYNGGAITLRGCMNFKINGNIIANNQSQLYAGVKLFESSTGILINNSIVNNKALGQVGGVYMDATSNADFYNNIIWNNIANQTAYNKEVYSDNSQPVLFNQCCIQNGSTRLFLTLNPSSQLILTDDPDFVNKSNITGLITPLQIPPLDWHVKKESVCFNAGNESQLSALPEEDYYGDGRISYEKIDVGALETPEVCIQGEISDTQLWGPKIEYICHDVTVTGSGSVNIIPGTTIKFRGNYKVVFEGNAYLIADGNASDSITFTSLNPDLTWKGLRFQNITSETISSFNYCTFEHANNSEGDGGAISISNVPKVKINHSVFDECQASARGGAIFAQSSILEISNSQIINCTGGTVGGGICCIGKFTGDNLVFTGNHANSAAGALHMENTNSNERNTLKNSLILNNTSMDAIISSTFNGDIFNCRFFNNESETIFGLFWLTGSHRFYNNLIAHNKDDYSIIDALDSDQPGNDTLYLFNNTIVNNKIDNSGSGTVRGNAVIFATNNILWNNSQNNEFRNFSNAYFSNNCVKGGVNAVINTGEIHYCSDPYNTYPFAFEMFNNNHTPNFVKPSSVQGQVAEWENLDYSLTENSLLLNKGTNTPYLIVLPENDLNGDARISNSTVDIGCYETEISDCLSGIINTPTTIGPGIVNLCGNLEVVNGGVLTIAPNTTIKSNYYYGIKVNGGKMIADGGSANSRTIIFMISDNSFYANPNTLEGGWKGIEIVSSSDSCIFNNCWFYNHKHVNGFDSVSAAITSLDSKLRISKCGFSYNNLGLRFEHASPLVKLSGFRYNGTGAYLSHSDAEFRSDTVMYTINKGFHAFMGSPKFKLNWFDQNVNATGITCELSNATIYDNFFQYCNPAIKCINGNVTIDKNIFDHNVYSIKIESTDETILAGQVKINKNKFVTGNTAGNEIFSDPTDVAPEIIISNNLFENIIPTSIYLSTSAFVINNTFVGTSFNKPAIKLSGSSSFPVLSCLNNIYWVDANKFISKEGVNASAVIGYNCVRGGESSLTTNGSNFTYLNGSFNSTCTANDPGLLSDYKIPNTSSCKNTGTPSSITDLTLIGQKDYFENSRIRGGVLVGGLMEGRIDMGYHECEGTIYPVADFSATPRKGIIPFTVQFTDQSVGENLQYDWDLDGDGQTNSILRIPEPFTYNTVWNFDITLAVSNSYGFSPRVKDQYITAYQIPNYVDDFEGYSIGSSLANIVYWDVINAQNAPKIELAPSINSQAIDFTSKWAMMQLANKTQGVYEISFNWLQLPNTTMTGKINIDNAKQNEEILLQSKFVGSTHQIEISVLGIDFDYSISVTSENIYKHYNFEIDFEAKKIYFFLNNVLKFTYSASEHGDVFLNKLSNLYLEGDGYLDNFRYVAIDNINLSLIEGWQGISLYNDPYPGSVEQIFAGLNNNLIILYNYTGIYHPSQGVNTLGEWDNNSGYVLKMNEGVQHSVNGWRRLTHQLNLASGWNICPVLSSCQVPVAELFAGADIQIAKDVAGYGVYWPQYGINTLGNFNPGKAYFVRTNSSLQISFPQCDNKKDVPTTPVTSYNLQLPANLPWEVVATTAVSHTIAIPADAFAKTGVEHGSVIGAFDESGICFGIVDWRASNTSLSLFGNDPLTSAKDGFDEGDPIYFRVFDPFTEKTTDLLVEFALDLPQADGRFYGNGLSLIKAIELNSAGMDESMQQGFMVYPNPADATLNVSKNFDGPAEYSLINVHGKTVFSSEFDGLKTEIDVSGFATGVYFIQLKGSAFSGVKRVVIK